MHTKAVYQGAKGLARPGCAVLRFNFRGVGASEGSVHRGDGEKEDFTAALDYMAARYPGAAAVGRGLLVRRLGRARDRRGGRSRHGAHRHRAAGDAIGHKTFPNTLASTKPKFFVQGEADEICPLEGDVEVLRRAAEPKELVVIDAADHLFDGHSEEVGEALEDLVKDFHGSVRPMRATPFIVSAVRTPVGKAPNGALR